MAINCTGDLQHNSGYGSSTTAYGCRAFGIMEQGGTHSWIFQRGFNASITDNGVGWSTVTFSFTMPDSAYSVQLTQSFYTGNQTATKCVATSGNMSTTGFSIQTEDVDAGGTDITVAVAVFR